MRTTRKVMALLAALIAVLAMSFTSASAQYGGGGGGGSGGGGGEETTATNNLSVPAVFVGGVGFGLTSPALVMPTGAPSTGYYADPSGYYYIQGVNTWQAEYAQVTSATATPKWGDNLLGGSASLKVGSPIRVEMALTSTVVTSLRGFTVIKLDDALDRLSRYGTKATSDGGSGWMGNPATMPARVWTSGATVNIAGPTPVVAAMPGEINATGAIVFGYNWRPQSPGDYTLTFSVPVTSGVSISDGATTGTSTSLVVHVNARGGGGGGGHRP